jgi:cytochrome c biogenesis protein CcdA
MTYSNLGWLSVIIIGILVASYVLKFLNKKVFKSKSATYRKILMFFRKIHKPLGIALLIVPLIHGYMALGTLFRLHTGTLLYLSLLLTATMGGSFYKLKKKEFFVWHKRMALLTVILFLIHFFFPSAIYYLLN